MRDLVCKPEGGMVKNKSCQHLSQIGTIFNQTSNFPASHKRLEMRSGFAFFQIKGAFMFRQVTSRFSRQTLIEAFAHNGKNKQGQ